MSRRALRNRERARQKAAPPAPKKPAPRAAVPKKTAAPKKKPAKKAVKAEIKE